VVIAFQLVEQGGGDVFVRDIVGIQFGHQRKLNLFISAPDKMDAIAPEEELFFEAVDIRGGREMSSGGLLIAFRFFGFIGQVMLKVLGVIFFGIGLNRF
jgi:hypothetical protein